MLRELSSSLGILKLNTNTVKYIIMSIQIPDVNKC